MQNQFQDEGRETDIREELDISIQQNDRRGHNSSSLQPLNQNMIEQQLRIE